MPKNLLIIESPAKARTIKNIWDPILQSWLRWGM